MIFANLIGFGIGYDGFLIIVEEFFTGFGKKFVIFE